MSYKYYVLGDTTPIRVAFNEAGHRISAEIPEKTGPDFKLDMTYLSKTVHSDDAEEVDEPTFAAKVNTYRHTP